MRTIHALAVGLATSAALGLAAPTASAADASPLDVVVTPAAVARGAGLTVAVRAAGCASGTVESPAFARTSLRMIDGGDSAQASPVVDGSVAPGRYDVTARCEGRTVTRPAALTVFRGGVRGGVGGSTHHASTADMAVGGGLVGAAVLGGAVLWLRRRFQPHA